MRILTEVFFVTEVYIWSFKTFWISDYEKMIHFCAFGIRWSYCEFVMKSLTPVWGSNIFRISNESSFLIAMRKKILNVVTLKCIQKHFRSTNSHKTLFCHHTIKFSIEVSNSFLSLEIVTNHWRCLSLWKKLQSVWFPYQLIVMKSVRSEHELHIRRFDKACPHINLLFISHIL